MIKKVTGTLFSKILIAIMNFVLLYFLANYLGASGLGLCGLIIVSVALFILLSSLIGGSAIVYLVPRSGASRMIIPSLIWSVFVLIVVVLVFLILDRFGVSIDKIIPHEYLYHVLSLGFVLSLATINHHVLIGQGRIKEYNILKTGESALILSGFLVFYFHFNFKNVWAFIYALYLAYLFSFLLSTILIRTVFKLKTDLLDHFKEDFQALAKYGIFVQIASLIQMFNYRLNYYLINFFIGVGGVGVFDLTTKLSEGIWLPAKSIGLVQYSEIANKNDRERNIGMTISLLKLIIILSIIGIGVLLLIPNSFYVRIFSEDFIDIKVIMLYLAIGIVSASGTMIISSFFSGNGKYHINTLGSGIGLVLTLVFGIILIPKYGVKGAAITASISYSMSFIYSILVFVFQNRFSWKMFFITAADLQRIKSLLMSRLQRK